MNKFILLVSFLIAIIQLKAQSKKEQIQILSLRMDSLTSVISNKRNTHDNQLKEYSQSVIDLKSEIESLKETNKALVSNKQSIEVKLSKRIQVLEDSLLLLNRNKISDSFSISPVFLDDLVRCLSNNKSDTNFNKSIVPVFELMKTSKKELTKFLSELFLEIVQQDYKVFKKLHDGGTFGIVNDGSNDLFYKFDWKRQFHIISKLNKSQIKNLEIDSIIEISKVIANNDKTGFKEIEIFDIALKISINGINTLLNNQEKQEYQNGITHLYLYKCNLYWEPFGW
jgi:hypothetical protein